MKNTAYKVYTFDVTTAGQSISPEFDLEKNVKDVVGIALSADLRDLLFYSGTQRIDIGGIEIFPEGYESNLLMAGITVKPNDKFHTFSPALSPGNGKIKLYFVDKTNPAIITFRPYRVTVTVAYNVQ
jgi:hypothetical protein